MSAKTEIPEPSSYKFIMRKQVEHDPTIEELVCGYDETAYTRDVTHPDGLRRRTIFISSQYFRDRLVRLGWEDVSTKSLALRLRKPEPAPEQQQEPAPEQQQEPSAAPKQAAANGQTVSPPVSPPSPSARPPRKILKIGA